jgi:DNA-binding response OmpR family regulator
MAQDHGPTGASSSSAASEPDAPPEGVKRDQPWIDGGGLLRRGRKWVALPEIEWRLLAPMVQRSGSLVRRDELIRAAWPDALDQSENALNVRMNRIRRRVAPLGITITTVRGRGYVLTTGR